MTNAAASDALRVGLYGLNGHQIARQLVDHPLARCVAVAGFGDAGPPDGASNLERLEVMLADDSVDLVSLCSPRRAEQARHAIDALEAGKHVYAEKPSALTEAELDAIVDATERTGKSYHEMAGSMLMQPYRAMREVVRSGRIGDIVQVIAQKSYPYFDGRPGDEAVDGGLFLQVGVHAARWVEHVAGVRMTEITGRETIHGNPRRPVDGLRMASVCHAALENGGVAAITCNYLNRKQATAIWGYEELRIWGTQGFVESLRGGQITRLVIGDEDHGELDVSAGTLDYFDLIAAHLVNGDPMPLTLEEELHPTRMLLRAKAAMP